MVFRENGGKSVVANGVLKGDNRILTANERGESDKFLAIQPIY